MSSVTAVPLRPLGKGTIVKLWIGLLIVVLLGAGLAWLGTSRQQIVAGENGVSYRIYEQGEGEPVTPADVAMVHVETRSPSGEVLESTKEAGQPAPITADTVPPWLNDLFLKMRKGAAYQVFVPARVLLNGQPLPPDGRIKEDDMIEFRLDVVDIQRDGVAQQRLQQQMMQQMQQQMMQQQMEGGGPPGGPPGGQGAPGAPGGAPQMAPPPPAGPGGR